jgi:predicted NBD/HSP70 family sugar kinase
LLHPTYMTTRHRSRNPGSQTALRQSNQQRILTSLVSGGPSTQAEISRNTGLSNATVSNIVKALAERGIVTTAPTTSSGRRALSVSLSSANGAVAVGIDFGRRHVRVIIAGLDYQIIAAEAVELPLGHTASSALDAASLLLEKLLIDGAVSSTLVLGVGVGIPGPIDRRTETVIEGAILPEWVGITHSQIEARLNYPVYLDNDANLGALAEVTWGPHGGASHLVFVKIGTGIGAGLILNGVPFGGSIGVTGEIGHTPVHDHGLLCRCGNRGCLETVASTTVMLELLSRTSPSIVATRDIVREALAGDHATLRIIEDAGLAVGRSVASIVNLVNPGTVVIGGPLAGLGALLLEPIRRGLDVYAVPMLSDSTELVMSSLGEEAEALGAVSLVLRQAGMHLPVA